MARKKNTPVEANEIVPEKKVTSVSVIFTNGNIATYKIGQPEGQQFKVINIAFQTGSIIIDIEWSDRMTRIEYLKNSLAGWDYSVG